MKKGFFLAITVFAIGLGTLFITQATVSAQECHLIRIHDREKAIALHPETSQVSKGSCVIWVNWSTTSDVSILFNQGKKVCKDVVEASMDFTLNKESCLISKLIITKGGTASLVYENEETFEFVAKSSSGKDVKGKIVVK